MRIKAVVHEAEDGGFWVEVPVLPGCVTQAETQEELMKNLHEAIEGTFVSMRASKAGTCCFALVMPGLDPRIDPSSVYLMDCRVKPFNDDVYMRDLPGLRNAH